MTWAPLYSAYYGASRRLLRETPEDARHAPSLRPSQGETIPGSVSPPCRTDFSVDYWFLPKTGVSHEAEAEVPLGMFVAPVSSAFGLTQFVMQWIEPHRRFS